MNRKSTTTRLNTTRRRPVNAILALVMLLSLAIPAQPAFAASISEIPVGVTGRLLTPDQSGDTSNWVEIARSDDYSLIVRQQFININQAASVRNEPIFQFSVFGLTNDYRGSNLQANVNNWFNGNAAGAADNLPSNARLRSFTVQSDAVSKLGTSGTKASIANGLSIPSAKQVGTGNDIAFVLSYSESANFLSNTHYVYDAVPVMQASPSQAYENFGRIALPTISYFHMSLRSPGDSPANVSALSSHVSPSGQCFQVALNVYGGSSLGLIYPALWVKSEIFNTTGTVQVAHLDAANGSVLSFESFTVPAGAYGPYPPKVFNGYDNGVLLSYYDAASGTIKAGEVKTIIYQYSVKRVEGTIQIMHVDLTTNTVLWTETFNLPPGQYGPYYPFVFPGYNAGYVLGNSAPISGTINAGETKTIAFGYTKLGSTCTIVVTHQYSDGYVFKQDTYTVPLGTYGPYYPVNLSGAYDPGFWDPTSAPVQGVATVSGSTIEIRFIYVLRKFT